MRASARAWRAAPLFADEVQKVASLRCEGRDMFNPIARTTPHVASLLLAALATACIADAPSTDEAPVTARERDPEAPGRTTFPADAQVTVTATDCPFDFTAAPSPDKEAITVLFGDTMLSEQRPAAHCRIGIDYTSPAGWRFWRPSAVARGYQNLAASNQNVWVVRTRVDGAAWGSEFSLTQGPVNDNLQVSLADGESRGETPTRCGATSAHIDLEILGSLFAAGEAVSTVDSLDTEIDWAPCE